MPKVQLSGNAFFGTGLGAIWVRLETDLGVVWVWLESILTCIIQVLKSMGKPDWGQPGGGCHDSLPAFSTIQA